MRGKWLWKRRMGVEIHSLLFLSYRIHALICNGFIFNLEYLGGMCMITITITEGIMSIIVNIIVVNLLIITAAKVIEINGSVMKLISKTIIELLLKKYPFRMDWKEDRDFYDSLKKTNEEFGLGIEDFKKKKTGVEIGFH
jgi:hypothetical protein